MKTIKMQCKVEFLRIWRNHYYVFWSLLMPIIFYFIFTKVVNTGAENPGQWQAHYLMSMAAFSVMGSAIMQMGIRLVQERNQGWTTLLGVTPLSSSVYFLGKMFGQTVMHLCSILIIFIAGILINGVSLSVSEWILSGLWILIAAVPFLALGTLVGSMKRADTASGISNILYLLLALGGGMWMPLEIFPKVMQQIGKWLPSYNYGNGAWLIVQGQAPELRSVAILLGYLAVFMLLSVYIRNKQKVA